MSSKFTVIRLLAPHDSNGNPRAWYVVYDASGRVIEYYEQGYEGAECITNQRYKIARYDCPINIAVSMKELKRILSLKSST